MWISLMNSRTKFVQWSVQKLNCISMGLSELLASTTRYWAGILGPGLEYYLLNVLFVRHVVPIAWENSFRVRKGFYSFSWACWRANGSCWKMLQSDKSNPLTPELAAPALLWWAEHSMKAPGSYTALTPMRFYGRPPGRFTVCPRGCSSPVTAQSPCGGKGRPGGCWSAGPWRCLRENGTWRSVTRWKAQDAVRSEVGRNDLRGPIPSHWLEFISTLVFEFFGQ